MEAKQSIHSSSPKSQKEHLLYDKWTFWAHLPHDTDWSLKSYKKICNLKSAEDVLSLIEHVPEKMVQNCMLFVMRYNINPTCVNGITLSPKKSFCILKLWMNNVNNQNAKKICEITGLSNHGCLFKKHNPKR